MGLTPSLKLMANQPTKQVVVGSAFLLEDEERDEPGLQAFLQTHPVRASKQDTDLSTSVRKIVSVYLEESTRRHFPVRLFARLCVCVFFFLFFCFVQQPRKHMHTSSLTPVSSLSPTTTTTNKNCRAKRTSSSS